MPIYEIYISDTDVEKIKLYVCKEGEKVETAIKRMFKQELRNKMLLTELKDRKD